jgi:hypothetical protein
MSRFLRTARIIGGVSIILLLVATSASVVFGASLLGGKVRTGNTVTVPANEVVDHDLYVFAGTVTMDGTVHGDLVAIGGTITVHGSVSGEIIAAGGTIQLAGDVAGAVRAGGGQVTVSGTTGKDVLAGGGTLDVTGPVGGDLIFASGTATVSGPVTGSIEGRTGTYARSGSVGGTENVTITSGTATRTTPASTPLLDGLRQYLVVLLFGALALWLLPRATRAAEQAAVRRAPASLGIGLLVLVGYVVAAIALLLGVILLAILLGILTLGALATFEVLAGFIALFAGTLLFVLAIAFFGDLLVGLALGRLIWPGLGEGIQPDRWQEFGMLAVGAAVVVILTSLPIIGWIVKLFVVLLGLGAMVVAAWLSRRKPSAPAMPLAAGPATPPPSGPTAPAG